MARLLNMSPRWFVPESEEGNPRPSKFKIHPLKNHEQNEFSGSLQPRFDAEGKICGFVVAKDDLAGILQAGVEDWDNVEGDNGEPAPFDRRLLPTLPILQAQEIAREILRISVLSDEAKKNSATQ